MIELDLRQNRNGNFYSFHDENTKRIGGDGSLFSSLSDDDVNALDIGSWFSRDFQGENVPQVAAVFQELPQQMGAFLDIKKGCDVQALTKLIVAHNMEKRLLIWFQDGSQIQEFKTRLPEVPVKFNINSLEDCERFKVSRADVAALELTSLDSPLWDAALALNVPLCLEAMMIDRQAYLSYLNYPIKYLNIDSPSLVFT